MIKNKGLQILKYGAFSWTLFALLTFGYIIYLITFYEDNLLKYVETNYVFDLMSLILILVFAISIRLIFQIRKKTIKENILEEVISESSMELEKIRNFNKKIFDNVPVSILIMDKKGIVASANDYVTKLSGHSGSDMVGKNIFDFNLVKDNNLKGKYMDLLLKGLAFDQQNCIFNPSSQIEVKYLNIIAVPLKDKNGRVDGAISMALDNSKARNTELRLEEKAEQLYLINQIISAINSITDFKQVLWVILRNAAKLTSASHADIYLLNGNKLVLKEIYNLKYYYKVWDGKLLETVNVGEGIRGYVAETRKPYLCNDASLDQRFRPENNTLEIKSQLVVPIFSPQKENEIKGVIRVASDRINHFTKADEEILTLLANNASVAINNSELYNEVNSLKKFSDDIIDSSSLAIIVTNAGGKIIRFNNSAEEIISKLKLKKEDIFVVKDFFNIIEIIRKISKTKKSFSLDKLLFISGQGNEYYNIKIDPILNMVGELSNVITTIEDVTKKVNLEREIRDLNRTLEEKVVLRTNELNLANKKLEEAIELKNRFIADASHELRTPLTIIKGYLDIFDKQNNFNSGELAETISIINSEIMLISRIISDLAMLTKADHNMKIKLEKINLNDLINSTVKSLRVLAGEKNIELSFQGARDAHEVIIEGEQESMARVFDNLIVNAIKYGKTGGYVKTFITNSNISKEVKIVVEDNGIGIPQKDLPFIFERFYRVDKSHNHQTGSGLGLAICKSIVGLHQGRIDVESVLGEGSKFIVSLPRRIKLDTPVQQA